jgi:hypothetical protein
MVYNYPEEFKKDCFYFYEGGDGNEIVITRENVNGVEFMFCKDNTKHIRKQRHNPKMGHYIDFKTKKYLVKNKIISI